VVGPVPDPAAAAASLIERTRLVEPLQVVFGWEATDEGARARGRGVARVEPESKARLDLFLENGETALRAALVDGELRLPEGVRGGILPPPDLLWGTLGVVQPGTDALLSGADRLEGGAVRIRYGYPDGSELHYETFHGVLTRIDRLRGGRVVEEVALSFSEPGRYPTEAAYRHRAEFREMRLTRETLRGAEPFPEEIWRPSR
jgi:hypothetical protein